MKKIYMQPQMAVVKIAPTTLIAESLGVNNEAQNNVQGDVKDEGDWDELWDDWDE